MDTEKKSPNKDTWALLALLRFCLAVTVVAGHFSLYVRYDTHHIFGAGYLNPLSAVYGFFILSGYSIAASLNREQAGFIERRFARIWPLYFSAVVFGLWVHWLIPNGFRWPLADATTPGDPGLLSILASMLMLQTVIAGPIAAIGPTWSLAAEWWHYMISPWLRRTPTFILVAAIAVSFCFYVKFTAAGPGVPGTGGLNHGEGILALSWLWVSGFVYFRHRKTLWAPLMLFVLPALTVLIHHSVGLPYFITAVYLIAAERVSVSKQFYRFFNFLGDWSYPLYLVHIGGFIVMLHFGSNRSAITLGGTFLISLLLLFTVDYPGRRYFERRSPKAAVAASAA